MPWRWIIAAVWLIAWSLAARGFWTASETQNTEAARLALPPTELAPGAEVRVQARVAAGPKVQGPLSQKEGVAALFGVSYVTTYLDSQNKTAWDATMVTSRTIGPASLWLEAADGKRFSLPMDHFSPDGRTWPETSRDVTTLPPELHVSAEDVQQARSRARGQFHHYHLYEWLAQEGMSLFVVGRLESGTGDLRLVDDPVLKRIELFPGTQAELVEKRRGSASGLGVAGYIVQVLGFLPALLFGILFLRAKLAKKGPDTAPA